jgi:sec-independent protein translocase protein TatA
LVVVVLLFGGSRLADIGGSLGKGVREFRKGIADYDEEPDQPPLPAAPSEAPVEAGACASCGAESLTGAKFCANCGAGLTAPLS